MRNIKSRLANGHILLALPYSAKNIIPAKEKMMIIVAVVVAAFDYWFFSPAHFIHSYTIFCAAFFNNAPSCTTANV